MIAVTRPVTSRRLQKQMPSFQNAHSRLQKRSHTASKNGYMARRHLCKYLKGSINNPIQGTYWATLIASMQTLKKEDRPKASCLSHQMVVRVTTEDITSPYVEKGEYRKFRTNDAEAPTEEWHAESNVPAGSVPKKGRGRCRLLNSEARQQ